MIPKNKQIQRFTQSFVCAGPRSSIIAFFNALTNNGATSAVDSRMKILATATEKKRIALYCDTCNKGSQIYNEYPRVRVVDHAWWEEHYGLGVNREEERGIPKKSYNVPRQFEKIILECVELRDIETLIPEI